MTTSIPAVSGQQSDFATDHHDHVGGHTNAQLGALSLAALGVVFGDIATSPLYAINEIFLGHGGLAITPVQVRGAISLVLWAITLLIAVKYLLFVLRADNDGQGGVFALYGLLNKHKRTGQQYLLFFLMIAAGMLFGDGIITPAISVLSSVEGLHVATPALDPFIIPITIGILTGLFFIQRHGTAKVGRIFGPIVAVWLVTIAALGVRYIMRSPEILAALNPLYGLQLLASLRLGQILLLLGGVMLVITGGEALYADLGHFGIKPIRTSWFCLVYPCLVLNYLGQGGFLLSGDTIQGNNIFFSMVPGAVLYPTIALATAATIIASQALISGAFSLTTQAMGLGVFPRVHTVHTHEDHEGQIYIRFINWALYVGCVILVITFGSSSALASAYGLAVSYDMVTTSLAMTAVTRLYWGWKPKWAFGLFGVIGLIDLCFFAANSTKFFQGGFVPVMIGLVMFIVMTTWRWGRRVTYHAYKSQDTMTMEELLSLKHAPQARCIEKTVILMCSKPITSTEDKIPLLLQYYLDRYAQLPRNLILLDVRERRVPYIHHDRYQIRVFQQEQSIGSVAAVTVNFGFMEEPNVEVILDELAAHHQLALAEKHTSWYVHAAKERLIASPDLNWLRNARLKLFFLLRQLSVPAYYYYGLGTDTNLSIEVFPVKIA